MQDKKDSIDFRALLFRYIDNWKIIIASIVVCVSVAFIYSKIKNPVFEVNANVLIKGEDEGGGMGSSSALKSFNLGFGSSVDVEDELEVIASYSIMKKAISQLNLTTSYNERKFYIKKTEKYKNSVVELKHNDVITDTLSSTLRFDVTVDSKKLCNVKVKDKDGTILKVKKQSFPVVLNTIYGNFTLSETKFLEKDESYRYTIVVNNKSAITEKYRSLIDIYKSSKKANAISLSIRNANISLSKDLLNTIIDIYNHDGMDYKNASIITTSKFLNERLQLLSVELSDIEGEIESYKKANSLFDLHFETTTLFEETSNANKAIININNQIAVIEELQTYINKEENKYELIPSTVGIKEDVTFEAIKEYNKHILDRYQLVNNSTMTSPVVTDLEHKLTLLRLNVIKSLENLKEYLITNRSDLNLRVKTSEDRYSQAPTIEREYIDIKRKQRIKEQLVVFLMEKNEENSLALVVSKAKAKIIDDAYNKLEPVSMNRKKLLLISMMLGLMLPIGAITIYDATKITFSTRAQLEEFTMLPFIGEICKKDDEKNEVITKNSTSSITELFKLLRVNLGFVLKSKSQKVILITSTQSGEGKSFVSINLAKTFALMGKKVVLVGLDIRKPRLLEYLDIKRKNIGVTNFLSEEEVKIQDLIINKEQDLDIIPSGPLPPNPSELMVSERMSEMFEYLKSKYDYVIVDSAPVGMVSDSFEISKYSDTTLYVTRANVTTKDNIRYLEKILTTGMLKNVYLVLNGTDITKSRYYGNGYGYGYGEKKIKNQ